MVCSLFYRLVDRTDTSSFTGYIDRYHGIPHTGDFLTKTIIEALIPCVVVGYLGARPVRFGFCPPKRGTSVEYMSQPRSLFYSIYILRSLFYPHRNYVHTLAPLRIMTSCHPIRRPDAQFRLCLLILTLV